MDLDNNNMDSNNQSQGDIPLLLTNNASPSQGETILLLILPFLQKNQLVTMSTVNKHLHGNSWRHLYNHMVLNYPLVPLEGSTPSNPEMVVMHLPPRIVLLPSFSPEMLRPSATRIFPVSASEQPQIHSHPRESEAFGSMTWSEKGKAIAEYVKKVDLWFSSVTAHRAEEHETFVNDTNDFAVSHGQPVQEMILVLGRTIVLNRDLETYPFCLQGLNEDEIAKVKLCFYERIIKETVHQSDTATTWPLILSRTLLNSLHPLSLALVF